jgi:hypothetical protein
MEEGFPHQVRISEDANAVIEIRAKGHGRPGKKGRASK